MKKIFKSIIALVLFTIIICFIPVFFNAGIRQINDCTLKSNSFKLENNLMSFKVQYNSKLYDSTHLYHIEIYAKSDNPFEYQVNNISVKFNDINLTKYFNVKQDSDNVSIDFNIDIVKVLTDYWNQTNEVVSISFPDDVNWLKYIQIKVINFDSSYIENINVGGVKEIELDKTEVIFNEEV